MFNFIPEEGLLNQHVFPSTPASETEARQQFMTLFDQIKDYVNANLLTKDFSSFDTVKNVVKLENGFQLCWGSGVLQTGAFSGTLNITYGTPFAYAPLVITSIHDAGTPILSSTKDVTKDGFNAILRAVVPSGGTGVGIGAVRVCYVAYGRWK